MKQFWPVLPCLRSYSCGKGVQITMEGERGLSGTAWEFRKTYTSAYNHRALRLLLSQESGLEPPWPILESSQLLCH